MQFFHRHHHAVRETSHVIKWRHYWLLFLQFVQLTLLWRHGDEWDDFTDGEVGNFYTVHWEDLITHVQRSTPDQNMLDKIHFLLMTYAWLICDAINSHIRWRHDYKVYSIYAQGTKSWRKSLLERSNYGRLWHTNIGFQHKSSTFIYIVESLPRSRKMASNLIKIIGSKLSEEFKS